MESPIEVVRRFCAAWSDDMGAAELAAFFTEDAVYQHIPLERCIGTAGRDVSLNTDSAGLKLGGHPTSSGSPPGPRPPPGSKPPKAPPATTTSRPSVPRRSPAR